jgi:hypothetical protein
VRVWEREKERKRVGRRMCASGWVRERKKMRMENVCERRNECLFVCEYERERERKSKRHIMKERRSAWEREREGGEGHVCEYCQMNKWKNNGIELFDVDHMSRVFDFCKWIDWIGNIWMKQICFSSKISNFKLLRINDHQWVMTKIGTLSQFREGYI